MFDIAGWEVLGEEMVKTRDRELEVGTFLVLNSFLEEGEDRAQ